MNYDLGLDILRSIALQTDWYQDFVVYEASLRENLRDEKRYGSSEQSKRDRFRVVEQLNFLCMKELNVSFNDICLGKYHPDLSKSESKMGSTNGFPSIQYNINTSGGNYYAGDNFSINNITLLLDKVEEIVNKDTTVDDNKKQQIMQNVQEIGNEILKEEKATVSFLTQRLRNIKSMAPDIFDVIVSTLTNPVSGLSLVGRKVLEKAKKSL